MLQCARVEFGPACIAPALRPSAPAERCLRGAPFRRVGGGRIRILTRAAAIAVLVWLRRWLSNFSEGCRRHRRSGRRSCLSCGPEEVSASRPSPAVRRCLPSICGKSASFFATNCARPSATSGMRRAAAGIGATIGRSGPSAVRRCSRRPARLRACSCRRRQRSVAPAIAIPAGPCAACAPCLDGSSAFAPS